MKKQYRYRFLSILLAVFLLTTLDIKPVSASAAATEPGKVYVMDQTGQVGDYLLDLSDKAASLSAAAGIQITCLLVETTNGAGTPAVAESVYQAAFGDDPGIMLIYSEEELEWFLYRNNMDTDVLPLEEDEALWEAFASQEYYDECVNAYLDQAGYYYEVYLPAPWEDADGEEIENEPGAWDDSRQEEDPELWNETEAAEGDADAENATEESTQPEEAASVTENNDTTKTETLPISNENQHALVADHAGVLSDEEAEALETKLEEISERQLCEVTVVTVNSLEGKTASAYADDYYSQSGYGYGEEGDGILLLVSMEDRAYAITTFAFGQTAFTDAGLEYIVEKFRPDLSDGNYAKAFTIFADWCDRFLEQAYTGEVYDVGHMPKQSVSLIWIPVSIAIGFLMAYLLGRILRSSLKSVSKQESAAEYEIPGSMQLYRNSDMLVNTIVTSRKIPKKSENSSGGSSSHTSSSGKNHGGISGKF